MNTLTITIDGHLITLRQTEVGNFENGVMEKIRSNPDHTFDYMVDYFDNVIVGGSDYIFKMLDPDNKDPSLVDIMRLLPKIADGIEKQTDSLRRG